MTVGLFRVTPSQCVMLFGLATDREQFFADQSRQDRDFSRRFRGVWLRYQREVAAVVGATEPVLRSLGVSVEHRSTLHDLSRACERYRVVLLFSHWASGAVEFHDGLHPWERVAAAIPQDFDGVIDLCVCHPLPLAYALRRRHTCLVRYSPVTATPAFWLYMYVAIFRELAVNGGSYVGAVEAVFNQIQQKFGED